jgi:hypothetical protein
MGQEAACVLRQGRETSKGKARLEAEELIFSGDVRLKIPFRSMQSIAASDGVLTITYPDGKAAFEIGAAAPKWADKIKNPKTVLEKLGVKPDHKVSILEVKDAAFQKQVAERANQVSRGKAAKGSDLVFLGVDDVAGLKALGSLEKTIARNGAIWVVWPKGQPHIKEDHVRGAALKVGLTDVKVVAFSPTHSALKLVIPLARR